MSTPEIIYNVSQTQLSIARHYGGIKYNGAEYVYNPVDDTLTKKICQRKRVDQNVCNQINIDYTKQVPRCSYSPE